MKKSAKKTTSSDTHLHAIVKIFYPHQEPRNTVIETNFKKDLEVMEEVLEDYLIDNIGAAIITGKDKESKAMADKSHYSIKIEYCIRDDTYTTKSDTGCPNLTRGIVMWVLENLSTIPRVPLTKLN